MLKTVTGRKLWRIPERGMVKGVCAGIADYLDVPVKLVRTIVILSMIFGLFFLTLLAYIILTFALDPLPYGTASGSEPDNRSMLAAVDAELAASEQRLRAMERYVTSDACTLRGHFHKL